jgi:hypothetical protein
VNRDLAEKIRESREKVTEDAEGGAISKARSSERKKVRPAGGPRAFVFSRVSLQGRFCSQHAARFVRSLIGRFLD